MSADSPAASTGSDDQPRVRSGTNAISVPNPRDSTAKSAGLRCRLVAIRMRVSLKRPG
jgi:hypothetical protein